MFQTDTIDHDTETDAEQYGGQLLRIQNARQHIAVATYVCKYRVH